jgi:predicted DNA-binding protein (MmcQ/YjbR family)
LGLDAIMNIDRFRAFCRMFPDVSENVQWGDDLVFKVGPKQGGKMFAVACLDPNQPRRCSFKCTAEEFAELTERAGVVPAPYLARAHWVSLERFDALPDEEIRRLVKQSYDLVREKRPKRYSSVKAQGRRLK